MSVKVYSPTPEGPSLFSKLLAPLGVILGAATGGLAAPVGAAMAGAGLGAGLGGAAGGIGSSIANKDAAAGATSLAGGVMSGLSGYNALDNRLKELNTLKGITDNNQPQANYSIPASDVESQKKTLTDALLNLHTVPMEQRMEYGPVLFDALGRLKNNYYG